MSLNSFTEVLPDWWMARLPSLSVTGPMFVTIGMYTENCAPLCRFRRRVFDALAPLRVA